MTLKKISRNVTKVMKQAVRLDKDSIVLVMPKTGQRKVMRTFNNISNNTERVFRRGRKEWPMT